MHTKDSKGIVDTEENKRMGILETAGMERRLHNMIKRRKLWYFGHVIRKEEDCLVKETMQGTTPGAKNKKDRFDGWMDNMEEWTGMQFEDLLKKMGGRRK